MNRSIAKPAQYDEIDNKIDDALDRVGQVFGFWIRLLLVVGFIGGSIWLIYFSSWSDTMSPIFSTILGLIFNLLFVGLMMIFQFVVLFWFLGRGRTYWLMPGETGVGFKDYKG